MKNKIILILSTWLLGCAPVAAQFYQLSTNVCFTNTIAASATLTYTGTNVLDLSMYRSFALTATGSGTNLSTNTLSFTFLAGPTTTNWEAAPRYTLTGTVNGTNPFCFFTNLDAGMIGYLKPYQIVSSVTNEITNAWSYGVLKMFPRN